ncbi:MAG: hypothetical protein ACOYOU_10035 [Kiritimatiellia bacterium]
MKISLSQKEVANLSGSGVQAVALAQAVAGCKKGDLEGRRALMRLFAPLIAMLAAKRAGSDAAACTELIERGRAGLCQAAKRFPPRESIRHFRLFALDHIEAAMDKPARGLSKLFG